MRTENPLDTPRDRATAARPTAAENGLAGRRVALLVGAIVCGAILGLFFLDRIFTSIPTDVRRLGILVEALNTQSPAPRIVVLGNSAIMSGVDMRALTEATPENPLAWNLASTGQTLAESYLLTQELPKTVENAIYGLSIRSGPDEVALHPNKYNTLFMYGYRPNRETVTTLQRIYGKPVASELERSRASQIFSSRWALRQFIDTQIRILLRSDLALGKATFDLFHPQSYEKPIDPTITARFIAKRSEAYSEEPATVAAGSVELARQIAANAGQHRRRTIFLFPPIHPDLLVPHESAIVAAVDEFRKKLADMPETQVLAPLGLLNRSQFIDDMHPTNSGAQILTDYLVNSIMTSR